MRIFSLVFVVFIMCSMPATAANLLKELVAYEKVIVQFSDTAGECNLGDQKIFKKHVNAGLANLGLNRSPDSRIVAVLNVAAKGFGVLNSQCATTVSLNLQTTLHGSQIITENPEARKVLDYVGDFPISIFRSGMFGVQAQSEPSAGGKSTATRDAVIDMTDQILKKLEGMRQK